MPRMPRHFIFSAVLTLAFGSALPARAIAAEGDHTQFCESATDASQTVGCINKELDFHQQRLSTVYKEYSETLPPEGQVALDENQKKWLAYRDAECGYAAGWTEGQVAARIYELSCMATLTQQRADRIDRAREAAGFDGLPEFGGLGRWMNAIIETGPTLWNFKDITAYDTNCDGTEDRVVAGIDLQSPMENGETTTLRKVAIAHAGHTGKPSVYVLSSLARQGRCKGGVSLEKEAVEVTSGDAAIDAGADNPAAAQGGDSEAASETSSEASNKTGQCRHVIRFGDGCDPAILEWNAATSQYTIAAPVIARGPEDDMTTNGDAPAPRPAPDRSAPPQKPKAERK